MTFSRLCIGLASAASLLSSVALAQDSYDVRRNVNFAEIKTFAFKATPPMEPVAEKTTTYDSPLVVERTHAAIAAQLESRGLRRDDQHPDIYIVTHRTYKVEYIYFAGGPCRVGLGSAVLWRLQRRRPTRSCAAR